MPGGYSWEFSVGVCRPVIHFLTLFHTKKCNFSHLFSDLAFRQKLCYLYLTQIRTQTKKILQIHFEYAYSSFFFIHRKFNDKYVHTLQQFPRKPYPIPDQNGQSAYPFSDQNGAKTLPDGAAHTYIAYRREYPSGKKLIFIHLRKCMQRTIGTVN